MSNPYTPPTLSGYNANPPSDDGSETSANTVKWETHKDKLGDPLKTYAAAISAAITAAFADSFGSSYLSKSANYTVLTSDRGAIIEVTASCTITLPALGSAGDGFPVVIFANGSGIEVVIDGDSSETINGAVSITLLNGQSVYLNTDGNSWVGVITGAPTASTSAVKTSAESRTSTTTLADDSELVLSLAADRRVRFEAHLDVYQDGGDLKFFFTFSNSPQNGLFAKWHAIDASGVSDEDIVGTVSANTVTSMTDANKYSLHIVGQFRTNATTGGTLTLEWAQNSSDVDATILAVNSWMKIEYLD